SVLGFQVPVITFVLLRNGVISGEYVKQNRSSLWFIGMAFGAFLSPPDPLSMFLVAGPVLILLEMALIVDRITQ
ncbi:MAG: twin-arginine translocase subunit TatC, partial [Candidatus Thalassarchaeaceae archaeon]|nr:twin-arginine translocase subunit TatC [Candidatus Thalassarchaeaceae archaeon]